MAIKVSIVNSITNQTYSGQFDTQDLATAWINQETANDSWGLPQRQVLTVPEGVTSISTVTVIDVPAQAEVPAVLDGSGNVITPEIPAVAAVTHLEYIIPADYTVTQTDCTAQLAEQAAIAKGLQAQALGATLIAQVYYYNELNLASGALTPALFSQLMADVTVSNIERCFQNGSISTANALISGYAATLATYFSSAQITALQTAITAAISSLG